MIAHLGTSSYTITLQNCNLTLGGHATILLGSLDHSPYLAEAMLKFRHFIVSLMLGSLLLTQFAVAAYVCPATSAKAQVEMMQMPDCEGMDSLQPALCHAHTDSSSHQNWPDQVTQIEIPPFVFQGWVQILPELTSSFSLLFRLTPPLISSNLHEPPLRVLHCSFLH